jgi:hypothetical protein
VLIILIQLTYMLTIPVPFRVKILHHWDYIAEVHRHSVCSKLTEVRASVSMYKLWCKNKIVVVTWWFNCIAETDISIGNSSHSCVLLSCKSSTPPLITEDCNVNLTGSGLCVKSSMSYTWSLHYNNNSCNNTPLFFFI